MPLSETTALVEREDRVDELSLVQRGQSGSMGLALLSEADFEQRLALLKLARARVERIQLEIMTKDEDYGVIPGTPKPTLLKPGAEKLCQVYRLVPTFSESWIAGDGESAPALRVRVRCSLHLGDEDGPVVGQGVGAANAWEKKYRYRAGGRACPACGADGTIKRSKFEKKDGDKGWYCYGKAGGCGAEFRSDEPDIVGQESGQIENPDPFDVENTILKMAVKRSQIDAVLRTTATSGLFAQEVEELVDENGNGEMEPERKVKPAQRSSHPVGPTPQTGSGGSTGKVTSVVPQKAGDKECFRITLNTGFICATWSKTLADTASGAQQREEVVRLDCTASKDPKYKPKLDAITVLKGGAA